MANAADKKRNIFRSAGKFFRDCKNEIKKIVWPTPKAVFKTWAWCCR